MTDATAGVTADTAPVALPRRRVVGEVVRFGLTGVLSLAAEVVLFATLIGLGMSPLVANPITMGARLVLAFWLTRQWVFPDGRDGAVAGQAVLFVVLAVANILVVQAALTGATAIAGGRLPAVWATAVKVVAIGLTFAGRFVLSRRYVFGRRQSGP